MTGICMCCVAGGRGSWQEYVHIMNASPSLRGSLSIRERLALLENNCTQAKSRESNYRRRPLGDTNVCSNPAVGMDELKTMLGNCMLGRGPHPNPTVPKPYMSLPRKASANVDTVTKQLQLQLAKECSEKLTTQRRRKQQIRKIRVKQALDSKPVEVQQATESQDTTPVLSLKPISPANPAISDKDYTAEGGMLTWLLAQGHAGLIFSFLDDENLFSSVSRVCMIWDR